MVRTRIASLVLLVLMCPMAIWADEAKVADKEGFRVYTISPRCRTLNLVGVYESPAEAIRVATETRAKRSTDVEVTTGSEGKNGPATRHAALFMVYTKVCDKAGWQRQGIYEDVKQAEEVAKTRLANKEKVEIVREYKPTEVFEVYGGGCSRSWRLRGTYLTIRDAHEAAEDFRTNQKLSCKVTTGIKGRAWSYDSPKQYKVYVQGCKGGWGLAETTTDPKKVQEVVEARKKQDVRTEVVQHFVPATK